VAVLIFSFSPADLEKQLVVRLGQSIMTCPTTACYNGLFTEERLPVGGKIRFFGDGWQASKLVGETRYWRIPVMDGEFVVEESFGYCKGVGGGNFLILAESQEAGLEAATCAVEAMGQVPGVILPFPGGMVRSGSKVGSKYKFFNGFTNTPYCSHPGREGGVGAAPRGQLRPGDRHRRPDPGAVEEATRVGVLAACLPGVVEISAGNYGGKLGKYQIHLHKVLG